FKIVGAKEEERSDMAHSQEKLVNDIQREIDELRIETDGNGWRAKAFLYCVEVRCPETSWLVPLLPTLVVSASKLFVVKLVPNVDEKRYEIIVHKCKSVTEMKDLSLGTIQGGYLVHSPDGVSEHRINIKTIRG